MLSQWSAPAPYAWGLSEGEDLSRAPGVMEIAVTEVQGQQTREAVSVAAIRLWVPALTCETLVRRPNADAV